MIIQIQACFSNAAYILEYSYLGTDLICKIFIIFFCINYFYKRKSPCSELWSNENANTGVTIQSCFALESATAFPCFPEREDVL